MGRAAITVRVELMQTITDHYRPGDRLPSEPELAAAYSVSRSTIREALQALETDGVVRRIHGLGTFVNQIAAPRSGGPGRRPGRDRDGRGRQPAAGCPGAARGRDRGPPRDRRAPVAPAGRSSAAHRTHHPRQRPARGARRRRHPPGHRQPCADDTTRTARCTASWSASAAWCCWAGWPTSARSAPTSAWRGCWTSAKGDALLRLEQVERSASEEAVLYSLEHFVPARFDLTISRHRQAGVTR